MKKLLAALLALCLSLPACGLADGVNPWFQGKIDPEWQGYFPATASVFTATGDEKGLPAETGLAAAFTASRWKDYTCVMGAISTGDYAAVVMKKDRENVLAVLTRKSGKWKIDAYNNKAIYQGDRLPCVVGFTGDTAFEIWYENDGGLSPDEVRFAQNQYIWRISKLVVFSQGTMYDTIDVYSDKLIFRSTAGEHEGESATVYGTTSRDLATFSLSAFPKTYKEAKNSLSYAPEIPWNSELSAEEIQFTGGQKYAVYSGPGTGYERMANGKAAVSTNDWIQVFGEENGWLLIQYDISATKMRFGYIEEKALPKGEWVKTLAFAGVDATITRATSATDDPLGEQDSVRSLAAGTRVTWLAKMGDWVYIEAPGVRPLRAFVPASAIQAETNQKDYPFSSDAAGSAQRQYVTSGKATVTSDGRVYVTMDVTAPQAWVAFSAEADCLVGYQLYANNLPAAYSVVTGSDGVSAFSLAIESELPAGTAKLGLCPIFSQSGLRAEETIVIAL